MAKGLIGSLGTSCKRNLENMKKYIEKYKVLLIFIVLTMIGLLVHFCFSSDSVVLKFWGALDVSFAVSLGVMAYLAYKEFISSEDEIKIYFHVDDKEIDTGLSLLRKDCSRGEILGILGMIQHQNNKRFTLEARRLPSFLKEIKDIQRGYRDKILVVMTQEEFEQYDINVYRQQ